VILDAIDETPLLALGDDDRIGAALTGFLIDGRENIAARRNTAREFDRAEVAQHRRRHPI